MTPPMVDQGRADTLDMTPPGPPAELAETHISVITMVGDRAYKLLKTVAMGFLDHRRREDRLAACRRETEVNRRFAPDVYLGVLDVLNEDGTALDHLIAMRRMPASRCLAALLGENDAPDLVRQVARAVAGFHRAAPTSPRIAEAGSPAVVLGLWEEGLDGLTAWAPRVVPADDVERARVLATRYVSGRRQLFERRVADGWVRDGHGDLLARDVFCLADGPRVLDCLAFDDRLRNGDVLADVAFLAMDLEARGHPRLGELLVREWTHDLGESHPASLEHLYVAYRAHVRSKIAALRSAQGDAGAAERARALHALALEHLGSAQVRLILIGGPPGTGKSTVAAGMGDASGWTVVRSDAIRKDLAGRPQAPADPGALDAGLYSPEATDRVYDEMLLRAKTALGLGESVILDASWARGVRRRRARDLAAACGATVTEIRCSLAPIVAAERIRIRRAAGEGPSDATPEIAERIAARVDPWPEARTLDTEGAKGLVLHEARRLVDAQDRAVTRAP